MVLNKKFQVLCILFLVTTVYYPSIFAPFNTIDDMKMVNGLLNSDQLSLKELFIPNSYGQYYRPLLYLTFILDKFVWGIEPSFMHLENILLHLGNTLLVFWLTRLILSLLPCRDSYQFVPIVTALLFGLHPIATEPVNWISGRTDLLSGFFVLLSFGLFMKGTMEGPPARTPDVLNDGSTKLTKYLFLCNQRAFSFFFLGGMSLLAGCLSKETALFLLPAILLWCIFPPKECNTEKNFSVFPFIMYSCAGVIYLILRWMALSAGDKIINTAAKVATSSGSSESIGFFDMARVATKTAGFYFKKLFIPVPLNFGITTISPHYLWLGLMVICCVAWCLYRRTIISYLFLAAFMLTSSAFVLPILKITWTPLAERYLYMASAPFVIGVTIIYAKDFTHFFSIKLTTIVVAAILGSAVVVTAQRNILWQSNLALFEDTIAKSPDFGSIKNEYAIALRENGRTQEADKIMLSNVVDEFQPSSLNKIRIMVEQGKLEEARSMLLERLRTPSEYESLSYKLLLKIDETRRAKVVTDVERQKIDLNIIHDLQKLASITADPFYQYRLGTIHLRLNDKVSAKASFKNAYQNSSKSSHYHDAAKKLSERL